IVPMLIGLTVLLAWITFFRMRPQVPETTAAQPAVAENLPAPTYRRILVPLDHSDKDRVAIAHAAAMARLHGATLHLLHVEEGVTSQFFGAQSSTAEVHAGEQYFQGIVDSLAKDGIQTELTVAHGRS